MNLNQDGKKVFKPINQNQRLVHTNLTSRKMSHHDISSFQMFIGNNPKKDNNEAPPILQQKLQDMQNPISRKKIFSLHSQQTPQSNLNNNDRNTNHQYCFNVIEITKINYNKKELDNENGHHVTNLRNGLERIGKDQQNKGDIHLPQIESSKSNLNISKKNGFQSQAFQNKNRSTTNLLSTEEYLTRQTPINLQQKYQMRNLNSDLIYLQPKRNDTTTEETIFTARTNNEYQDIFNYTNKNIINKPQKPTRKSYSEFESNQLFQKYNGLKPISTFTKDQQNNEKIQNQQEKQNNKQFMHKKSKTKSNQLIEEFTSYDIKQKSSSNLNEQKSNQIPHPNSIDNQISNQQSNLQTNLKNDIPLQRQLKTDVLIYQKQMPSSPLLNVDNDINSKDYKLTQIPKQNNQIQNEDGLFRGYCYDQKGNMKPYELNFSVKTRAGNYAPNLRKINQDQSISISPFTYDQSYCFFGVCDGHGEYGHLVSNFVKKNLPKVLKNLIKNQETKQNTDQIKIILAKSIQTVSNDLLNSKIDTFMSGTTVVTVLIHNNTLWCGNCGDSRAIMGKELGRGSKTEWMGIPLSEDHKPNLPREKKRIIEHGGRVEQNRDDKGENGGIYRVWNLEMEKPGLAMSRSLGDKAGREVGVISDPDIYEIQIKEEDRFIIIASDGVWEFLTNQEVVKMVIPYYKQNNAQGAAEEIIKQSVAVWQKNDENAIDDITCIVLFLKFQEDNKKKVIEYI